MFDDDWGFGKPKKERKERKTKDKKCPNCGRIMERRKDYYYCPHCRKKHFFQAVVGLVVLDALFNKGSLLKR